jgi:hypothetical protein
MTDSERTTPNLHRAFIFATIFGVLLIVRLGLALFGIDGWVVSVLRLIGQGWALFMIGWALRQYMRTGRIF